ncbi:MAG: ATP-binding protein [Pseudobdellovibrionaceae bacterium]
MIVFLILFSGGISVLYYKTFPEITSESSAENFPDPLQELSQYLHQFDQFLIEIEVYDRQLIDKPKLLEDLDAFQKSSADFKKETSLSKEFNTLPDAMKVFEELNTTLKELHPLIEGIQTKNRQSLDHVYEALFPFEKRLTEMNRAIYENHIRSRFALFQKQAQSQRILGWTLSAIALCSILLMLISHGNIKNVALLLETSKHKGTRLKEAIDQTQRANRAKSEFLATMSHEIRTPLNAILGFTSLLLDMKLSYDQKDYVQSIRTSSSTLLSLINDILDVSKIEAGKLDLESIEFDLRSVYGDIANIVADTVTQKKLELVSFIDSRIPRMIKGDPARLKQILLNLLNNAIKFTPSGSIAVKITLLSLNEKYISLKFEVKDTGIGIEHRLLGRLFTPFTQADSSTTRRYGGSGLGLSICKQLAEFMGGEIGVTSLPDQGSTFWFSVKMEPVFTHPIENPLPPSFFHKDVLILTKNAVLKEYLELQLKEITLNPRDPVVSPETQTETATPETIAIIADQSHLPFNLEDQTKALRMISNNFEIPIIYLVEHTHNLGHLSPIQRSNYLKKPVCQQNLYRCFLEVLHITHIRWDEPNKNNQIETSKFTKLKPKVLLVEDNPINQKIALLMLEKIGCKVDVAANGMEALKSLQIFSYDLIFMDCQMPEMDGYEATRRIRRLAKPLSNIPIIALTANAFKEDQAKCLEAGMNDFVTKPVDSLTLESKVLRYLKNLVDSEVSMPATDVVH